ncbi:MAG TPA: hypothetical protein VH092_36495 [Urbifossiella sp.]|nr:hypothetical protein [Urbifossiella sp.]
MADINPTVRDPGPPLGSTADPVGYVPVSWMAVAAFATTAVFVIVLAVLSVTAWRSRSPLITPPLLALPCVAVVLAFAARRMVRTSEGTRTGDLFGFDLINGAWWGAVVVGLVYLTYMAAVNYSIQREAEAEVGRWVGLVLKDDLPRAFHRTRDPMERVSIAPDNGPVLENRYRTDWVAFRQCDLVRIANRNPGACEFIPGNLKDWSIKAGGAECVATGTIRCPEGLFPVYFPLKAVDIAGAEAAGGRQWQLIPPKTGFLREEPRITPYGWLVMDLQRQAREAAGAFLAISQNRGTRAFAAVEFAKLGGDPEFRLLTIDAGAARLAAVGIPAGLGWNIPDQVFAGTAAKLFRLPGGAVPSPNQMKAFLAIWNTAGVVPPGTRFRQSGDIYDTVSFTDSAVEVRVPVELPEVTAKGDMAARGRLVMVCSDPSVMADLKRLRAEANPDAGSLAPPVDPPRPRYPWRLEHIESDLKSVSSREADSGGGPPSGGPGGF